LTRADPLARAVFALLVIACFAAFFVTQRLKHTPTVIAHFELTPRFSPAGHIKQEAVSFKLTRADEVTVTIIDANATVVATLVRHHHIARYKEFSLRWNGRSGTAHRFTSLTTETGRAIVVPLPRGSLAPPGEYRVQIGLREQGRVVILPRSFTLVGG
jgi:hypothetical protein